MAMTVARKAHCPCGEVAQGDIVLAHRPDDSLIVGMVNKFVSVADQNHCAEIDKYKPVFKTAGVVDTWLVDSPVSVFVDLEHLRSNLTWAKRGNKRITILVPKSGPWTREPGRDNRYD